jgi:hypothetical protein
VCIHTGQAEKFAWPKVAWPNVAKQTFQFARCGCNITNIIYERAYENPLLWYLMSTPIYVPKAGSYIWYIYERQLMSIPYFDYFISTQPPAQDNFERPALVPEVKNACTTNVPGTHLNTTETVDICGSRLASNEPSYNKHTHQS